ncbi:MAG: tRNA (5-methylaminomethyl-2-thiouridine)(34)-methyltransferase MnmD [Cyclobacteriaceae bacterium]|jgi:tRNA U34 5-methylaminomethyl-2-thiouridine-forming methyltransferase MnmC|nr:tRNA (5-methylaminomethyl-2-thiouridine)(34)-methyltransferase MnmD [Cyclobacteriaceae bacterium]
MEPRIITTDDGSHSLYHTALNETYHSRHGALTESRHVFIENGLAQVPPSVDPIRVLEVGFGTGLNALLTWLYARSSERLVYYTGIEPFPLKADTWRLLNYSTSLSAEREFTTLHEASWNEAHELDAFFHFSKLSMGIEDFVASGLLFDVVYYDAFAPEKQPAMWSSEALGVTVGAMRQKGILVTYCAKGQFRRTLRSLGMEVEALPGPPGKREMTRARKT